MKLGKLWSFLGAAAVCWISVVGKGQGWVEVALLLN